MTRKTLILLAATGSAALLAGAFLFQFAGFAPCQMCLWQRWPHAAAVVIGVLALSFTRPPGWLAIAGMLAALTTAGLAGWHTGVEQGWWQGPASCTGSGPLTGDLLSTEGPGIVLCNEVALYIFGLSMAAWNAISSLGLALIWAASLTR
ncbi:MAG: disulfide bond formation protein B [Rhodobacterales bacterium]|nr:MAG: disulfide bond formation protein B [Rhodobacterales bacterium]